jgi:hypothetical protein
MKARVFSLLPSAILLLGFALLAPPGRGQEAPSARFAFSDTTLLRDTLGLKFDLLFMLADSLRVPPSQLRALAIRYRLPVERIVFLADSLRMPVDSVGAVMERESFNPLTMSAERISAFSYTSSYQVGQEGRTTWVNGTDYTLSSGGIQARNVTSVSIDRYRGNLNSVLRVSETEGNYRYSKNFSVGGRAFLQRNEGYDSFGRTASTSNEFQVTMRAQQQPTAHLKTGLTAFLGPFNEPESPGAASKRGLSSRLTGSLGYGHDTWLTYDLDARLSSRLGRGHLPEQDWLDILELFGGARGTLALLERTPVSLRFTHDLQRNRAEAPDTFTVPGPGEPSTIYFLRRLPSGSTGMSLALNLRQARGSMTVTGEVKNAERLLEVGGIGRTSTSTETSLSADARYNWLGWNLDGRFVVGRPISEDPLRVTRALIRADSAGAEPETVTVLLDYRQKTRSLDRTLDVGLDRTLTRKLSVRAKGRVFLSSPRSTIVDSSYRALLGTNTFRVAAPDPRENYDDALELQGIYTPTQRLSTSLSFEISTRDNINLLATGSIGNTRVRTYRTSWSWTYRLMDGLTATQRNMVSADYSTYPFAPQRDLLALRYDIRTSINAVINPRFRIDLSHANEEQPRGSYIPDPDGRTFFRVASRTKAYTLSTNVSYTPHPAFSLTVTPNYRADTTPNSPDLQKSLDVAGGANVNLPVSSRGTLSGNMARTYSIRSATGGAGSRPIYSWTGALQFSWRLD